MKKILLLGLALFLSLSSFGQEHFVFNRLEIKGTILEFGNKLITERGFEFVTDVGEDGCEFKGKFAGKDDTHICVFYSPISETVTSVVVLLREPRNDDTEASIQHAFRMWTNIFRKNYELENNKLNDPKRYISFSDDWGVGDVILQVSENYNIMAIYNDLAGNLLKLEEEKLLKKYKV
jgi:hypothetical protein